MAKSLNKSHWGAPSLFRPAEGTRCTEIGCSAGMLTAAAAALTSAGGLFRLSSAGLGWLRGGLPSMLCFPACADSGLVSRLCLLTSSAFPEAHITPPQVYGVQRPGTAHLPYHTLLHLQGPIRVCVASVIKYLAQIDTNALMNDRLKEQ